MEGDLGTKIPITKEQRKQEKERKIRELHDEDIEACYSMHFIDYTKEFFTLMREWEDPKQRYPPRLGMESLFWTEDAISRRLDKKCRVSAMRIQAINSITYGENYLLILKIGPFDPFDYGLIRYDPNLIIFEKFRLEKTSAIWDNCGRSETLRETRGRPLHLRELFFNLHLTKLHIDELNRRSFPKLFDDSR